MHTNKIYDVVCIGNYTKDTIISPAGTTYVDGGAVNYSAHAAARLGTKVVVVTHLAREDERVVEKFKQAGIDCYPTYTSQSTCMRLEYPTTNPDFRNLSVTGLADSITAREIEVLQARSAIIGSSLRGEVGLDVVQALRRKGFLVAADVQGYARVLREHELAYEPWNEMTETLSYLDVVKADAVEAEYLTGESDIYKAARAFSAMGPAEIVLTHKGGMLVYVDGKFYDRLFYSQNMSGRSGRGDTCIGAYVSKRLTLAEVEALIESKYNGSVH